MSNCPELKIHKSSQITRISVDPTLESKVAEAREYTSSFFKDHHVRSDLFTNQTQWAFYDRFFHEIAMPYSKYKNLLEECYGASFIECISPPKDLITILKLYGYHHSIKLNFKIQFEAAKYLKEIPSIVWRYFLIFHSIVLLSMLYVRSKKGLLVVWTGDYLGPQKGLLDPRLGDLETRLNASGIAYLPFVRSSGVSSRLSLKNFITRRGKAIYYEHLNNFISSHFKSPNKLPKSRDFFNSAFNNLFYAESKKLELHTKFWAVIFHKLQIKTFLAWFLSSRTASLIWGAKKANVPTIGFMHGVSVLSFMGHELMPEYEGPPIGTDCFGTWSKWWQNYFLQHARIYPSNNIEVSGPLKKTIPLSKTNLPKVLKTVVNVFIVSEAHLPIEQLLPYLEEIIKNQNFKIFFKIRSFGADRFWNLMKDHSIYNQYHFEFSDLPSPECFKNADIILGTHSTAVLEAMSLDKPILILNTAKWGDYFSFNALFEGNCPFWVKSPGEIQKKIDEALTSDRDWIELYSNFFGEDSGTEWILKKIESMNKLNQT